MIDVVPLFYLIVLCDICTFSFSSFQVKEMRVEIIPTNASFTKEGVCVNATFVMSVVSVTFS